MISPGTKWNDYPSDSLYLWNGDVLYVASEDSYNISGCDEAEGYKDSWVVDIYSLSEPVPQGGQWMEREYISDMNYTIQGIMDRLGGCDLWKADWTILDPDVGEVIRDLFEKCQEKNIKITALNTMVLRLLWSEERNWIPVSKDLPKTPIRVQVQLDNNWIITAYYDEGEWYDVPGDGEPIDGVLAWMPLPEPYKG